MTLSRSVTGKLGVVRKLVGLSKPRVGEYCYGKRQICCVNSIGSWGTSMVSNIHQQQRQRQSLMSEQTLTFPAVLASSTSCSSSQKNQMVRYNGVRGMASSTEGTEEVGESGKVEDQGEEQGVTDGRKINEDAVNFVMELVDGEYDKVSQVKKETRIVRLLLACIWLHCELRIEN